MNNTICRKLKLLREEHNLTQTEFAEKFNLTASEINSYETNVESIPFLFLQNVCKFFNLSLCYFDESEQKAESVPANLIIAAKNNKFAIFDTSQSIFLCPHKYDNILLSESGYHLGIIYNDKDIVHNDIITNSGKVLKVDSNYAIGYRRGFSKHKFAIAYKRDSNSSVIINEKGEQLTREYKSINIKSDSEGLPYYYIAKVDLDGTMVDYYTETLQRIDFHYFSIEDLCKKIEMYGSVMLNELDTFFLHSPANYIKILTAIDNYILNNIDKVESTHKRDLTNELLITICFLESKVYHCSRIIPISFPYHYKATKREYIPNRIERDYVFKRENELLKKILD